MPRSLHLLLALLLPALAHADDDPPLVGRPVSVPFSGASARFVVADGESRVPFAVTATAAPTELASRSPLVYTVTVRALGPMVRPPHRPDLRQVRDFARLFHIIDEIADVKEGRADPTSWHHRYRLTPRWAEVDEIPGFPFVFYNPDLRPPERAFQVLYSDPIAIRQTPARTTVGPPDVGDLELADSSALGAKSAWGGPGPALWLAVGLGPPAIGVVCCLLWRRLYPDAARAAARRRSRAARLALEAIRVATRDRGRGRAERLTAALVGYLRERVDLAPTEPTPEEVSVHLAERGFSEDLARETALLLSLCAAARFAPAEATEDLAGRARLAIQAIEEASCPQ